MQDGFLGCLGGREKHKMKVYYEVEIAATHFPSGSTWSLVWECPGCPAPRAPLSQPTWQPGWQPRLLRMTP